MTTNSAELALRFQFEDEEQQRRAANVGMWVFLATELLMFGTLFTAYGIYRLWYGEAFMAGSNRMDLLLGGINTAVLLTSTFTMALAVHAAQRDRDYHLTLFLIATILIGTLFLGIKFYEYWHHWQNGEFPGLNFRMQPDLGRRAEMFFFFYFVMTGLHAVHMIVGLGLLFLLALGATFGMFTPRYHTPVELTGLYWHFVDIVWIFLYPIFYLVGRHLHS
jgi:cytochrome c oxidase subunit 3